MIKSKIKDRIKDSVLVVNVLQKLQFAAPYIAASAVAVGVSIPLATQIADSRDSVIEARQTERIESIQAAGDDSSEELRRLLDEVSRELRDTAATLEGELQSSFLRASNNLTSTANRLDSDVVVTNRTLNEAKDSLNESITSTKDTLEASDLSNKDELVASLDNVQMTVETSIATVQTNLDTATTDIQTLTTDLGTVTTDVTDIQQSVPSEFRAAQLTQYCGVQCGVNATFSTPFTKCTTPIVTAQSNGTASTTTTLVVGARTATGFSAFINAPLPINATLTIQYVAACPI